MVRSGSETRDRNQVQESREGDRNVTPGADDNVRAMTVQKEVYRDSFSGRGRTDSRAEELGAEMEASAYGRGMREWDTRSVDRGDSDEFELDRRSADTSEWSESRWDSQDTQTSYSEEEFGDKERSREQDGKGSSEAERDEFLRKIDELKSKDDRGADEFSEHQQDESDRAFRERQEEQHEQFNKESPHKRELDKTNEKTDRLAEIAKKMEEQGERRDKIQEESDERREKMQDEMDKKMNFSQAVGQSMGTLEQTDASVAQAADI